MFPFDSDTKILKSHKYLIGKNKVSALEPRTV